MEMAGRSGRRGERDQQSARKAPTWATPADVFDLQLMPACAPAAEPATTVHADERRWRVD